MTDQSAKQEPVISIHGLERSFGDNHVLQSFDLDLFPGENVVVLGKSGSGKSVLIKCIIGLMAPDAGSIKVFGKEVTELSRYDLDLMRVDVGFLFQSNALYDSMTVRENLEFPLRRHTMVTGKETVNDLVMEALTNVGLTETVDMLPEELSGGMRKRIALARALILKPKIILYDEPTTGLDPITGRGISQLMLDIQKKYNTSSIIISHDMNCAKTTANRIAMLIDGKCYALDTFENLSNSSDNRIKEFFDH
jgi:phospholipid/cholesterol/gamma-HCH transport system ATP-binding protein